MSWQSQKQQAWGNSPSGKKALGTSGVNEWNKASKGKSLPKFAGKGTRARLNTAASKAFFGQQASSSKGM